MKVLQVLYSGLGGHGNIFFAMVNADAKNEFEYEALFYGIEEVRSEFIEGCAAKGITWYFAKKRVGIDLKYYVRIFKLIRKSNPDIIFLHGSAYILPAKLAQLFTRKKCKIVVRETQANHLKTRAQWISLSGAMLLADDIVCLTDAFVTQIRQKLGFLFRKNKVRVISNGINLHVYKPADKVQDNVIVIGMQSRIVRIKDHITLLKAFALLKKEFGDGSIALRLRIAGDGDFKTEVEKYATEIGLKNDVEFTGMIPETELVPFLQSLDIYVHASLGETMSTAIMQAMACKLPIVASDVNGINNMITNGQTGILVPVKNEIEMAAAFKEYINDPDKRKLHARQAFQYAEDRFSNQKMLERYKDIFL